MFEIFWFGFSIAKSEYQIPRNAGPRMSNFNFSVLKIIPSGRYPNIHLICLFPIIFSCLMQRALDGLPPDSTIVTIKLGNKLREKVTILHGARPAAHYPQKDYRSR